METKERMAFLVETLNKAAKAYYMDAAEIMSNEKYDRLYDELLSLEKATGLVLAGSPTHKVGYEVVSRLPKERHEKPMLSLDKTKSVAELKDFLGQKRAILSWKLDGLTVVLTYRDGKLFKAVTRGNGEIGEVVTGNARAFHNVPSEIPYKGELILRGEAVIGYKDFAIINASLKDVEAKYKNPRNLASGSVRQLDSSITAERRVQFIAFSLVKADHVDFKNSREEEFLFLERQGFDVVERRMVTAETLEENVREFAEKISENDFPSDGLVLLYDDIAYGNALGETAKFPRNAMAFKWADEKKETVIREVEWSPSRTGLINPVAIFDPVELEGTTVTRASLHNVSIVKELQIGIGDRVCVYKANMIIPQIAENLTKSGHLEIPSLCPACGGETKIMSEQEAETLVCINPDCSAKRIKAFALFASRDAMNIEGLSEATLAKLIAQGFLKDFSDIFKLQAHRQEMMTLEGFGEKSVERLLASIDKARHTRADRVLYALGIKGIGAANAKVLLRAFDGSLQKLLAASEEEISAVDGIGIVLADSVCRYFGEEKNVALLNEILSEVEIEKKADAGKGLEGKTFVITGSLVHFKNRSALKEKIESLGGKVTGSVSKHTDYLINNDRASQSGKNKKAQSLEIPIITEEEFLSLSKEV